MKKLYIALFLLLSFHFPETRSQIFNWAKGITGSDYNSGNSIKVDTSGNSYITGQFIGTANFNDNIHLTSFGGYDIFIAKFDPNGNCVWAKQAGGDRDDYGYGLSIDSKGNIYVTGAAFTAKFDTIQLINHNNNSATSGIFIAKYDPNGNCLWAKQAGGNFGSSISVDINGNSYLVGSFKGPAIFGIFQLDGFSNSDIFIAKYDPNGNCLWAKQAGGNMWDYGFGISIDPNGNSYITGAIQDTTYFGTIQIFGFGGFLAKYDNNGNCLWAKAAPGVSGQAISVDKNENIYFTGWFDYTATFDSIQIDGYITYPSNKNIFIAKYDLNGNCLWAKESGGPKDDVGEGISVDINGNCYISGYFDGSITFGTITISTVNSQDLFIAKYDPKGNCLWATHAGGRGSTAGVISNDASGNIYCTGSILFGPAYFDTIKLPVSCAFISKLSFSSINNIQNEKIIPPNKYELSNAYPNPWNPTTTIRYQIPINTLVTIKVFDALGREVSTLVNEEKPAGNYEVTLNSKNLSSGVYYCQMKSGNFIDTKKIILIK